MGFFSKIKNFLEGISDQGPSVQNNAPPTPSAQKNSQAGKGYDDWYENQQKVADETLKKSKHLERFKASEIPLKTRNNGLCVPGDWAWLDFYDNGIAILTYETVFDISGETKPEEVAAIIRESWEEQRGVHRRCYNYHMCDENTYVLKISLLYGTVPKGATDHPCNSPISYLKYDGNILSKLNNRYLTEEEKKIEWIDSMFGHFPKFTKTHLTDFSKGDAAKVLPAKRAKK